MTAAMPQPEKMTPGEAKENKRIAAFFRHVNLLQTIGQRYGQAVWNAADEFYPGIVEDLRGTAFDPFHHSTVTATFLSVLFERLERRS